MDGVGGSRSELARVDGVAASWTELARDWRSWKSKLEVESRLSDNLSRSGNQGSSCTLQPVLDVFGGFHSFLQLPTSIAERVSFQYLKLDIYSHSLGSLTRSANQGSSCT